MFEPSASYTVPISRPMIPPPSTSIFSGMSFISSAPVESITRSSSGMNGRLTGSEPAAIIAFSKVIVVTSSPFFTSRVFAPVNLPKPCTCLVLRILDIPLRPFVNCLTTPSLYSRILSKSMVGSPNDTPWLARCFASFITLAT